MIDKISSWKYAENFNREPDHITVARNSAEQLGVESVTPATGAGLASIAAMLGAKNIVEAGTGAGQKSLAPAQSDEALWVGFPPRGRCRYARQ